MVVRIRILRICRVVPMVMRIRILRICRVVPMVMRLRILRICVSGMWIYNVLDHPQDIVQSRGQCEHRARVWEVIGLAEGLPHTRDHDLRSFVRKLRPLILLVG